MAVVAGVFGAATLVHGIGSGADATDAKMSEAMMAGAARVPDTQAAALEKIVRGFGGRRLVARLRPAPAEYGKRGAVMIDFHVNVASDSEQLEGQWQAFVISGILHVVSRPHGWPLVAVRRITIVLPNGKRRFDHESAVRGAIAGRDIVSAPEGELSDRVRKAVAGTRLNLIAVEFARPLGLPIPYVTVESSDPGDFARHAAERFNAIAAAVLRGPGAPRAEGIHITVRDDQRRWVASFGYAARSAATMAVANPAFAD